MEVSKQVNGAVNVVYCDISDPENDQLARSVGLSKFPAVHVLGSNSEYNEDNLIQIEFGDPDDIAEEARDSVSGGILDLSDQVFANRMMSNANELNKVTFVYLYEGGTPVSLDFTAVSGEKEFSKNFEFIAVMDPSPLTKKNFQIQSLPLTIGALPPQDADQEGLQTMVISPQATYWQLYDQIMNLKRHYYPGEI